VTIKFRPPQIYCGKDYQPLSASYLGTHHLTKASWKWKSFTHHTHLPIFRCCYRATCLPTSLNRNSSGGLAHTEAGVNTVQELCERKKANIQYMASVVMVCDISNETW